MLLSVTTNDGNIPSPANTFSHTIQIRQSSAAALAGWVTATSAGCVMTPPMPLTPRPARNPARHRRREESQDGGSPVAGRPPPACGGGSVFYASILCLLSDISEPFPSRCSELACLDELAAPCASDTAPSADTDGGGSGYFLPAGCMTFPSHFRHDAQSSPVAICRD